MSPANSTAPTPPIPPDGTDPFNVTIAEEIRQILRGRFLPPFLLLFHGTSLLWAYVAANDTSSREELCESDLFLWIILISGVGAVVSRGLGALSALRRVTASELRSPSRPRPPAWRIVWRKWVVVLAQLSVLGANLLPYCLLRFYHGTSIGTVDDFLRLVLLLSAALSLSAFAICLSRLSRWLAWPTWSAAAFVVGGLLALSLEKKSPPLHEASESIGGLAGLSLLYALFFLLQAASTIATEKENFSTLKRLLGWAGFVPCVICEMFGTGAASQSLWFLAWPLQMFVFADALTARSATHPFVLRRFIRWEKHGTSTAFLFAPNRATGLFYTLFTFFVIFGTWIGMDNPTNEEAYFDHTFIVHLFFAWGAQIFLPAGLAGLIPEKWAAHRTTFFWVIFAVLFFAGVAACIGLWSGRHDDVLLWILSPIAAFCGAKGDTRTAFITAHWAVALALLAVPTLREAKLLRHQLNTPESRE